MCIDYVEHSSRPLVTYCRGYVMNADRVGCFETQHDDNVLSWLQGGGPVGRGGRGHVGVLIGGVSRTGGYESRIRVVCYFSCRGGP